VFRSREIVLAWKEFRLNNGRKNESRELPNEDADRKRHYAGQQRGHIVELLNQGRAMLLSELESVCHDYRSDGLRKVSTA
jgi:hypothetical protein